MTRSEGGASATDRVRRCDDCGTELIRGTFALPILGPARFVYPLRGQAIESQVGADLCPQCGAITLTALEPDRVRRAAEADRRARPAREGSS
ncbi:MAG: hypothetical protein C4343_00190 [Chloroflexota bacterium]